MKNILKGTMGGVIAVIFAISTSCRDLKISMITPYVDESDIEAITAAS